MGLSAAKFRVTSHHITADYTIQITAIEHEPTDYEFTNTEVFIQKGIKLASNDPYLSQSGSSPSSPQAPYFPGTTHDTNGVISAATLFSSNRLLLTNTWKLTVTHATDVSQYNRFFIDAIGTGSTTAPSEAEFNRKGFTEIRNNNPPYDTTNIISLSESDEYTLVSAQYLYVRVRYRKDTGEFVLGPYTRVNNNQLKRATSFP